MFVPFLLFLSAFGAMASAQVRDVHYQGSLAPLNTAPTFDRGYLVVYDRDPDIDVYTSDGSLLYKASPQGPNGSQARIKNAAVDADGTVVAAVEYRSLPCNVPGLGTTAFAGGAIVLFDRTGVQARFIDTGCDYWPAQVAFGPDHSVWTLGYMDGTWERLTADYLILRNYSQDGRELGAFLPRASFPHPDDPHREPLIIPMIGLWQLRVVNGRVEATLDREGLWVETDLNGQETSRWKTGPNGRPTAITQDGTAYRQDRKQRKVFDRSAGVWHPVATSLPDGILIGADGFSLVFLLRGQNTLRWIPAP